MLPRSVFPNKEDLISLKDECTNNMEFIKQNIDPYKNRPIVVLTGMIGAGKSSLSCSLSQKSLIIEASGRRKYLVGDGVGQGLNACTTKPSILYNSIEGFSIVDLPGFEDNRTIEQEIINSISINDIFDVFPECRKEYKIVLVITSHDFQINRCTKLIDSFSRIKKMFPNYNEIKHTLGIIITKGDNSYDANEYVTLYNDAFNNTQNKTSDMIDLHRFLNQFNNNIFIFPQPLDADVGKQYDFSDHQRLLDFLKSNYIINPNHNIVVSNEAESNLILSYNTNKNNALTIIREICQKINNKYQNETSSVEIKNWIDRIRAIKNSTIEDIKDFEGIIKRNMQNVSVNDIDFNKLTEFIQFDHLISKILKSQEDKTYVKNAIVTWSEESIHDLSQKYSNALDNEQLQRQNEILRQEMERRRQYEEELERRRIEDLENERRLRQELELRRRQEEETQRKLQEIQSLISRSRVYGG